MPTMQFNLTSFTNKNVDMKAAASFSAYASGSGVANAMVLAARLTLNNIRVYSTQCYLELVKGSGIGRTVNFTQNSDIHSETVALSEVVSALVQSGDGPIVFTVRASGGSTGNLINLRDNVSGVLEIDYFIPQSDFTLSTTSLDAGQTITATITPTHQDADHEIIWRFQTPYKDYSSVQSDSASYSAPFTKSLTVPLSWLDAIPDSISGLATVTVNTYMGGVLTGSVTKQFTIKVGAAIVPSITSLAAARINNGVPTGWAEYVQGISGVQLTANGVDGVYGSAIVETKITGGGYTGMSSPYSTGAVNATGTVTFTCTVKDSRGRTKSVSVSVTFRAYEPPRITALDTIRCNSDGTPNDSGTYVKVTATYTIASVNGKNAITSMLTSRRPYTGGAYEPLSTSIFASGTPYVAGSGFDAGSSYVVKVALTDALYAFESTDIVPTEAWYIHYRVGGHGVAFGQRAEIENAVVFNPTWEVYYKGMTLDQRFGGIVIPSIWPVTSGGTGADTGALACDNLGAVKKSGDTMTGSLNIGDAEMTAQQYLRIQRKNSTSGIYGSLLLALTSAANVLTLSVRESNVVTNQLALYNDKSVLYKPLTLASGGTGAATAEDARTNLGITPANIAALALAGGNMIGTIGSSNATMLNGTGTLEQHVTFNHCGTSDQTVFLYGSANSSANVFGLWDATNSRSVWYYTESGNFVISRPVTLINALGVAYGGTGATTAAAACTNLGAVKKSGDTMTGNLTIENATAGARTTIYQYSNDATLPTDFKFGGLDGKWSLTCRGSGESYLLGFYSYVSNAYAMQLTPDGALSAFGNVTSNGGKLVSLLNTKSISIGSDNASFCHYYTDATNGHWFNKTAYVAGEIYAGASYNKKVYHAGNLTSGTGEPSGGAIGDVYLQRMAA